MNRSPAPVFHYAVLIVIALISLGPILWVLVGSFKTRSEIYSSAFSLPRSFGFANYTDAFRLVPIGKYFMNSLIVCTANTLLNILVVAAFAYILARFDFRTKKLLVAAIASVMLLPSQSLAVPIFTLLRSFHLLDTKTGLILIYAAFGIPVSFFILRSYYLSIPRSLEEAASIDGAGFLTTFLKIIVPLSLPGLVTAAILQFLSTWNEFFFALVLTSGDQARTVPIALSYYLGTFSNNYPALFAAVILTILPPIAIFVFSQEKVVESLTAGAVKG
ncbi:carbohydrate ABC transporter permease [Cohnella sp. REN36]|uniref:carbohydrate ABC transporter permease n=1 Tax=Cohnella sp. REN36 TaxID=2887347 RepID=UPI001D15C650|nr:carbohydrate ABC transporter permease [Cohnella sp. REN36]MCC3375256.1 carbohydrate ABC transporter permease [Cohnella sp. REN36]